jgi:hypothetical protein
MRIRGKVSPMRPAENRESEKPGFNRRQIDAGKSEKIERREDQHEHRNAPDAIDSRADRQAKRPLAIGEADAGKEADDASKQDGGGGYFNRQQQALRQGPAGNP